VCLTKEQAKARLGKPSDPAKCETEFDQAIAKIDAKAAKQGVACRYVDNDDGTVSDLNTLLQWEKKVAGGSTVFDPQGVGDCLRCVDDLYTWNVAMSEWLSALNGRTDNVNPPKTPGFADHSDWRLPDIDELQTILLAPFPCGSRPCIDPIFEPTAEFFYWSSSTSNSFPSFARAVDFRDGTTPVSGKGSEFHVRAVRGGR
jgi:hypothetical protein